MMMVIIIITSIISTLMMMNEEEQITFKLKRITFPLINQSKDLIQSINQANHPSFNLPIHLLLGQSTNHHNTFRVVKDNLYQTNKKPSKAYFFHQRFIFLDLSAQRLKNSIKKQK